jgi:hypothetical protein
MQVIEAQRASILEPHDHLHIKQMSMSWSRQAVMVHADSRCLYRRRRGVRRVPVAGSETGGDRRTLSLAAQAGLEVSVAGDGGPGENDEEEELYAAFAALGGPVTGDELKRFPLDRLLRLLGSAGGRPAVVRQASLLLGGDIAAAEAVVQDSVAALKDVWSRLGDLAKARLYFWQAVLNRSRSARRHERDGDHSVAAARGAGRSP